MVLSPFLAERILPFKKAVPRLTFYLSVHPFIHPASINHLFVDLFCFSEEVYTGRGIKVYSGIY